MLLAHNVNKSSIGKGVEDYPYLFHEDESKCPWVDTFKTLAFKAFASQPFPLKRELLDHERANHEIFIENSLSTHGILKISKHVQLLLAKLIRSPIPVYLSPKLFC